jgi:hypothetical protein
VIKVIACTPKAMLKAVQESEERLVETQDTTYLLANMFHGMS